MAASVRGARAGSWLTASPRSARGAPSGAELCAAGFCPGRFNATTSATSAPAPATQKARPDPRAGCAAGTRAALVDSRLTASCRLGSAAGSARSSFVSESAATGGSSTARSEALDVDVASLAFGRDGATATSNSERGAADGSGAISGAAGAISGAAGAVGAVSAAGASTAIGAGAAEPAATAEATARAPPSRFVTASGCAFATGGTSRAAAVSPATTETRSFAPGPPSTPAGGRELRRRCALASGERRPATLDGRAGGRDVRPGAGGVETRRGTGGTEVRAGGLETRARDAAPTGSVGADGRAGTLARPVPLPARPGAGGGTLPRAPPVRSPSTTISPPHFLHLILVSLPAKRDKNKLSGILKSPAQAAHVIVIVIPRQQGYTRVPRRTREFQRAESAILGANAG